MAVFRRNGDGPEESLVELPPRANRGRAAWIGGLVATLTLAVLVVFTLQNTADVDVAFLWVEGRAPLALALLGAGLGSAVAAALIGASLRRGTQWSAGSDRDRDRAAPPG